MRRYPLYGNVIVDSSNGTGLGGTLIISNSCNTSSLNNQASIAFAVADISYGELKTGLFSDGVDSADARITAMVDTVSPNVGTGLSVSVSPNHANPPVEALRVQSNGNVGIGTQNPSCRLDVTGNLNVTNTVIVDSLQFSDLSTQGSANYLTPEKVEASEYITSPSIITSHLSTTNASFETISISNKIVDTNNTGRTTNSFIYNATTMCHKDAIDNYSPLVVSQGHKVSPNNIGLKPDGSEGITVDSINSTNRSITFLGTAPGGFLDTPSAIKAIKTSTLCAITSSNSFTSFENLSNPTNILNKGIRGTGTSSNQPFVHSLTDSYNATTPTTGLTYSPDTTKKGYINSNKRLVSLDSYTNQNFISMTGTSNPAYISATFGTNEYTISSPNPNTIITNTITGTFSAVPLNSTQLAYRVFIGGTNDFITQLNNITAGTKITNINTDTGVLTLSLSHSPQATVITDVSGYVSAGSLKLESATALNQYVTGTGTNGIPVNINSFISAVPTGQSSTYTIQSGTGQGSNILNPTNTPSTSGILGYVRFASSKYWFISNSQRNNNDFVEGLGIPQACRLKAPTPTSTYAGQSKIMELTQVNNHTITATTLDVSGVGMVSSATTIKLTTNRTLGSSHIFENDSSFNYLIPNGTQIGSYNATRQEITTSGLTPQPAEITTIKGYMRTATLFEGRGLGNSTPRLNWFFTGPGIDVSKNYVSAVTSVTPFTLASTNVATTPLGSNLPGYTKFVNSSTIHLVLANSNPFQSGNYFITGTLFPENTGLSNGVDASNIIVQADYSTYTTANATAINPSTGYWRAYPISTTQYYCIDTISPTAPFGTTSYLEAYRLLDDGIGFTTNRLTQRGTPDANGLYTIPTSTPLLTNNADEKTGVVGAIYNAGGTFYFCSKDIGNERSRFIIETTIAPQTRVILNQNIFDKGSENISRLTHRTTPTVASTFLTNGNLAYMISNSTLVSGRYNTTIWCKFATTKVTVANNKFFINGGFANSPLNGAHISYFTQSTNSGDLGFTAVLTGDSSGNATAPIGSSTFTTSGTPVIAFFTCDCSGFAPAIGNFCEITTINGNQGFNYIVNRTGTAPTFTFTVAYGVVANPDFVPYNVNFYAPVNTTSSLLNESTSIRTILQQRLYVYANTSQSYSYYPSNDYSAYAPINIKFYNKQYTTIPPVNYSIRTPLTYNYITPLAITDYGRTTLSFYNTDTITYFTSFDINLPPASATNTLVGDNTIQTLTNKTLTSPLINGTIFNYVPWTAILDRSGEWDTANPATANPFIDVIDASGVTGAFIPRPASIAVSGTTTQLGSITTYYYSVMGKILYLNWYHFQSTNTEAANGTGTYLYRIPTGFPLATWLRQTTNPPNINNAYKGTRIGSGIFYVVGAAREIVSAYYVNITGARGGGGIARDYICIVREPGEGTFQSSGSFGYNASTASMQYTFQAEIPLA